jgi:hypothetical protein
MKLIAHEIDFIFTHFPNRRHFMHASPWLSQSGKPFGRLDLKYLFQLHFADCKTFYSILSMSWTLPITLCLLQVCIVPEQLIQAYNKRLSDI